MLDIMRKHSQSFLIYLVFGAIIVVFAVNFGPGSASCSDSTGATWAARVNGQQVRQQEYALMLNRAQEMERRGGRDAARSDAERLALRKRVIDDLVHEKVLAQEASRMGFVVSDDELLTYLKERFKVDDVTESTYREWVRRTFGLSETRFEDERRGDILRDKLVRAVRDTISVGDGDLKEQYVKEHDRAMISYVRFEVDKDKATAPSKAEVDKYLADHKEDVQKRYESEKFRYTTPQEVKARQILRSLARDASDAEVAKERGVLLDLREQIANGADFAALAKQHSQDSATAQNGGSFGVFRRGQLLKPIEDAAFALKAGEITPEPARSPLGLHLIQVEEIHAPTERAFDDVKVEVATSMIREAAADQQIKGEADALMQKLKAGKKLEEVTWDDAAARDAKEHRPVRRDSAWIQKSQALIPGIGLSKDMHDAIFAVTGALTGDQKLLDKPYKVGRSYVVAQLKERELPDLAKFEQEKQSLRDIQIYLKTNMVLQEYVEYLTRRADVDYNQALFGGTGEAGSEGMPGEQDPGEG